MKLKVSSYSVKELICCEKYPRKLQPTSTLCASISNFCEQFTPFGFQLHSRINISCKFWNKICLTITFTIHKKQREENARLTGDISSETTQKSWQISKTNLGSLFIRRQLLGQLRARIFNNYRHHVHIYCTRHSVRIWVEIPQIYGISVDTNSQFSFDVTVVVSHWKCFCSVRPEMLWLL